MIFVDTGIWFAANVAEDPQHAVARRLLVENRQPLVTTDYVVDEVLTLLTVRGHRAVALEVGAQLWNGQVAQLHWVAPEDVQVAWDVFVRYGDKRWSFTDCVSFAVMKRLGVSVAFAIDEHFGQFGFVAVQPA